MAMKKAFISIKTAVLLAALVGLPAMSYAQYGETVLGTGGNLGTSTSTQDVSLKVDGSALIRVVNSAENATTSGISMSLTGATEAGAPILDETTNSDTRIRLSSLVESGKTRTITASISPSLAGTDTRLYAEFELGTIAPIAANGGTCDDEQDLTDGTSKRMVSGITTCWTGNTAMTDGYVVTYRYAKEENATALQSRNIVVTYTITAEEAPTPPVGG